MGFHHQGDGGVLRLSRELALTLVGPHSGVKKKAAGDEGNEAS